MRASLCLWAYAGQTFEEDIIPPIIDVDVSSGVWEREEGVAFEKSMLARLRADVEERSRDFAGCGDGLMAVGEVRIPGFGKGCCEAGWGDEVVVD